MHKKKVSLLLIVGLIVALLTGVLYLLFSHLLGREEVEEMDITMFSAYTDCEIYQKIPVMQTELGKIGDAKDYGNENYVISVNGSTTEEYKTYLNVLSKAGFVKHSDNGEEAMEGYVLSASYQKENLTLTVSHVIAEEHTYISASYDLALSEHLVYQEEYMDGVDVNAKTKVHQLELSNYGNSFVIQLKNGHFIIHDGGTANDAKSLLDYLDDLTPGEEKPVVEAWFISHAHGDHHGALVEISNKYTNRIYVDGVYYTAPSSDVIAMMDGGVSNVDVEVANILTKINRVFQSSSGESAEFYRPLIGQRYYFCDITIDVTLTVEQIPIESYYSRDFNDTSTWLMHHIDGQKMLIAGDAHHTGMRIAKTMYDKSYFDLDVMAVFHHGINVYEYFTEYCSVKTLLYTAYRTESIWEPSRKDLARVEDNEKLRQSSEEYLSYGNGTVVLTFPYTVGTAETMETVDWFGKYGVTANRAGYVK